MKTTKIKSIKKETIQTYDITVKNNHNFFCNHHLIHNCDYRGEVGVILLNTSDKTFEIEDGFRIAQGVLNNVKQCDWVDVNSLDDLEKTDRGEGGFGSTGVK